jgi:hypothetical protein
MQGENVRGVVDCASYAVAIASSNGVSLLLSQPTFELEHPYYFLGKSSELPGPNET